MLSDFLQTHHEELAKRCEAKGMKRAGPNATPAVANDLGVPLFIEQLIETLRAEHLAGPQTEPLPLSSTIGQTAGRHGNELLRRGFTVDQVVHDYGDLCQAMTELATEQNEPITVEEFHTFNRCLDDAMAQAVTEFGRQHDRSLSKDVTQTLNERLGTLAHDLRGPLNTAMLAFHAIKGGTVALAGATGGVLDRSLERLRDVIDRSLAEVRLTAGLQVHLESISMDPFLAELKTSTSAQTKDKDLTFSLSSVSGLCVEADRQMLTSALENLLQNAFKFSKANGHVSLSVRTASERVLLEIADECGGLASGNPESLFQPFNQRNPDRNGVGLGLSISRRCIEANGGKLTVLNRPGAGCTFTIDLPLQTNVQRPVSA